MELNNGKETKIMPQTEEQTLKGDTEIHKRRQIKQIETEEE